MDAWLDAEWTERRAIAARLTQTAYGRRLLGLQLALERCAPLPIDAGTLREAVLGRLPSDSPRVLDQVARYVLRAWADPELREALRARPRMVLAAAGIALSEQTDVAIGRMDDSPLPGSGRIVLPLPDVGAPAVSPDDWVGDAVAAQWPWPWTTPEISRPGRRGEARAVLSEAGRLRRRLLGPCWSWRRAIPPMAAVGLVAVLIVYAGALGGRRPAALSGAAVGTGAAGLASFVALLVLVAAIGFAAAWRRRH